MLEKHAKTRPENCRCETQGCHCEATLAQSKVKQKWYHDESRWMSLPFRSAHVAVTICPSENFDWYHTPLKHSHKSHFRTSLEWISAPYSNLWTFLFAMSRFERYSWRSGQELLSSAEMQEAMQRNDCRQWPSQCSVTKVTVGRFGLEESCVFWRENPRRRCAKLRIWWHYMRQIWWTWQTGIRGVLLPVQIDWSWHCEWIEATNKAVLLSLMLRMSLRPTLLLVHGSAASLTQYLPLAAALHETLGGSVFDCLWR